MAVAGVPGVGGTSTGRCGTWDKSMMPVGRKGAGWLAMWGVRGAIHREYGRVDPSRVPGPCSPALGWGGLQEGCRNFIVAPPTHKHQSASSHRHNRRMDRQPSALQSKCKTVQTLGIHSHYTSPARHDHPPSKEAGPVTGEP